MVELEEEEEAGCYTAKKEEAHMYHHSVHAPLFVVHTVVHAPL
jgi:hypothetical protein